MKKIVINALSARSGGGIIHLELTKHFPINQTSNIFINLKKNDLKFIEKLKMSSLLYQR